MRTSFLGEEDAAVAFLLAGGEKGSEPSKELRRRGQHNVRKLRMVNLLTSSLLKCPPTMVATIGKGAKYKRKLCCRSSVVEDHVGDAKRQAYRR